MPSLDPTTTPVDCAARAGMESSPLTGSAEAHTLPALSSGLSRQRRWQLKQEKANQCRQCGGPLLTQHHCADCAEKIQTRNRNRYRLAHGIPLDAPLSKNGRPRIGSLSHQLPHSQLQQP